MSYIIVCPSSSSVTDDKLATIRAKAGQSAKILDHLKKVSEEVKSNEPETVQYQITQSDEDENEILIWEEYKSKEGHEHHRTGKAYNAFKDDLSNIGEIVSLKKLHPKIQIK